VVSNRASRSGSGHTAFRTFIGGAGTFFGPAFGAAVMTFFARVTSDLTRSWLLYQGLIFVMVMLFMPEGLGGIVALHARRLKTGSWKALVFLYLVCLACGAMLLAGVVFTIESLHAVFTDAYAAKRAAAMGAWVPYQLFGRSFDPLAPVTWIIPVALLVLGGLLLPLAIRLTRRGWLLATGAAADNSKAAAAVHDRSQRAAA
jgi:branched-chain amino acid transport system permease protein